MFSTFTPASMLRFAIRICSLRGLYLCPSISNLLLVGRENDRITHPLGNGGSLWLAIGKMPVDEVWYCG